MLLTAFKLAQTKSLCYEYVYLFLRFTVNDTGLNCIRYLLGAAASPIVRWLGLYLKAGDY